jgi:uncharacterized protein
MPRWSIAAATVAVSILAATTAIPAGGAMSTSAPTAVMLVNRGVVQLETSGSAGISARIAEDLASIIDDGATRRLVPLVGKDALQDIFDMISQSRAVGGRIARVPDRGIDIAIVQADALTYVKEQGWFPGFESSLTYIAKLYNEEFHLLVRKEINSLDGLGGQRVNVGLRGSGTAITAAYLFDRLKLPVTVTNDSPELALEKLRSGEIAALAFVAGRPAPLFRDIRAEEGFHLLAIPFSPAVGTLYAPAHLTAADYPNLVPRDRSVDTVAVGAVLVAADVQSVPERYRNLANFVNAFFTGFSSLLTPGHHPKWQGVNLAAELPGWRRYPPAEQWLQQNRQIASTWNADDIKAIFSRFIDQRRQSTGGPPMTAQEKDNLFHEFQQWQRASPR